MLAHVLLASQIIVGLAEPDYSNGSIGETTAAINNDSFDDPVLKRPM